MSNDLQNTQPTMTVEEVRGSLYLTDNGAIRNSIRNSLTVFQNDPNLQGSMKSRLKSPSSIMNKMQKRGLPLDFQTMQANIMDVAGVRVICSFEEDVFFLAKCLKDQSDIEIITEKDYISHPRLRLHEPSDIMALSQ